MFNPLVIESIRAAAFDFCEATLDTMGADLDSAFRSLRRTLAGGLESGDTYRQLARRAASVIGDEYRAARVAMTEATRAVHQGQQLAAKWSGVVQKKRWLASSDACPRCLEVAAKGAIGIDEPYVIDPQARRSYAAVYHPPRHPHCMCSEVYEIDESSLGLFGGGRF